MKIGESIPMIGKKFGKLTCLKQVEKPIKDQSLYYEFTCDCGGSIIASGSAVRRGRIFCCLNCKPNPFKNGSDHKYFMGVGEISQSWWRAKVLHSAKVLKNRKSFSGELLNIDKEYIWELFLKQKRKCALSGLELCFAQRNSELHTGTASLDRIDSKKGYIKGNVQWVHKDINMMKGGNDEKYFVELCKAVANNGRL